MFAYGAGSGTKVGVDPAPLFFVKIQALCLLSSYLIIPMSAFHEIS